MRNRKRWNTTEVMKVFLFEFATCVGCDDDSIAAEGLSMFKSLYDGFSSFSEVLTTLQPEVLFALQDVPATVPSSTSTRSWEENFVELSREADFSLIIAPEDDFLLYTLTKKLKSYNLGSKPAGVAIASDKWLTYQAIKRRANTPKTSLKPLDPPFLIKPRVSCGGTGIALLNDASKIPEGHIAQEYVKGKNLSVSLLVGDEVNVLSVNEQIVENFTYRGAVVPYAGNAGVVAEVIEEAVKAVEAINGLFGYVGVDIVLAEQPYVVDVNPRITTSATLFSRVYSINLAELLVRNYEGKTIPEIKPKRRVRLVKVEAKEANFIKAGSCGLRMEVVGQ